MAGLSTLSDNKRKHLLKMAYDLRATLESITPSQDHVRPVFAVCAEHEQNFDISKLWFWKPRSAASSGFDHICGFLSEQFPTDDPIFNFKATLIPKKMQSNSETASAFVESAIRDAFKMRRAGDRAVPCVCGNADCVPKVQILAVGYDVFGMLTGMKMQYKQFKKFCHGYLFEESGEPKQLATLTARGIQVRHELIPLVNPCLLDFTDKIAVESFERALALVSI